MFSLLTLATTLALQFTITSPLKIDVTATSVEPPPLQPLGEPGYIIDDAPGISVRPSLEVLGLPCGKPADFITKGQWSFQFLAGYYPMSGLGINGVPQHWTPEGKALERRPMSIDLIPFAFRVGYAPTDVFFDGTLVRGHGEVLLEWTSDAVSGDFGHYFTGPSLLLRYNWQQPGCRLVPYLQCGVGYVLTDAHQERTQSYIGGPCEFLLQAQLGLRYFVSPTLSLDMEGGYQHISNANTYSRNVGLNNFGGSLGFTYHFR